MIMKKTLVIISVLALLLMALGIATAEDELNPPMMGEPSPDLGGGVEDSPPSEVSEVEDNKSNNSSEPTQEHDMLQNETMEGNETKTQYEYNYTYYGDGNFEDKQFNWRNMYRNEIQSGIENETVVKECNITKKEGKMYIHSYEYQNGMQVEIKEQNGQKLEVKVSAEFKEGKVLVINVDENAFKIKNSQKLVVKFDGSEIHESDIDDIVKAEGSEAKFAKAIGEGGSQYVVYIPHFSEHLITIEIVGQSTAGGLSLLSLALGASLITIGILIIVALKTGKYQKN